MTINMRIEQEFDHPSSIDILDVLDMLRKTCIQLDLMLGTKKIWYEKGHSRKQALEYQVFTEAGISDSTVTRWEKRYKKNYPFFGEGIWDGGKDDDSAGIDLTSSVSSTNRRANPMSLTVEFSVNSASARLSLEKMITFVQYLLELNDHCSYLSVESAGYSFPKIVTKNNGYTEVFKQVFPDRVPCGWILYIRSIVSHELIPEAAKVMPLLHRNKRKGTIIVSTEDVFDGNNKEHIHKSNDIEIKLLDLGFLPLLTEL